MDNFDLSKTIEKLTQEILNFVHERDWEQFHDLKNLAMAISTESNELMAHFRWTNNQTCKEVFENQLKKNEISNEVADIFILLLEFCHSANIDLIKAVEEKMEINKNRYPIEKAKGNNMKYNELSKNKLFGDNVFVFSASGKIPAEHYENTIIHGVELAKILHFIKEDNIRNCIEKEYADGRVYLWASQSKSINDGSGSREMGKTYWKKMNYGDLVLGYSNYSIISVSYFVEKTKNAELGEYCWPNPKRPYDLIYFIGRPKFLPNPIPVKTICDKYGVSYFGKVYQGLKRVKRSSDILKDFGNLNNFIEQIFHISIN
jgi:NTP pyrophosphatase (non-canonical NTP hydrolase)